MFDDLISEASESLLPLYSVSRPGTDEFSAEAIEKASSA